MNEPWLAFWQQLSRGVNHRLQAVLTVGQVKSFQYKPCKGNNERATRLEHVGTPHHPQVAWQSPVQTFFSPPPCPLPPLLPGDCTAQVTTEQSLDHQLWSHCAANSINMLTLFSCCAVRMLSRKFSVRSTDFLTLFSLLFTDDTLSQRLSNTFG